MAQQVKQFLENIFDKEVIALGMKYQKDKIDTYNEYIEKELNSNCLPYYDEEWEEEIPFNLLGKMLPDLPDTFSSLGKFIPSLLQVFDQTDRSEIKIRQIFKISEYPHERFGNIWACYVSMNDPGETIKKITDCFIVAEIEGKLKFISKMGVVPDTKKWMHFGGDDNLDLRLNKLGKPTKIERYVEPTDEWSLKEYLKDK